MYKTLNILQNYLYSIILRNLILLTVLTLLLFIVIPKKILSFNLFELTWADSCADNQVGPALAQCRANGICVDLTRNETYEIYLDTKVWGHTCWFSPVDEYVLGWGEFGWAALNGRGFATVLYTGLEKFSIWTAYHCGGVYSETKIHNPGACPWLWGGTCGNIGAQTQCFQNGYDWDFETCTCSGGCSPEVGGCSPILIDPDGDGFALTNATNGVNFDVSGDGRTERVGWPQANSDEAFLALDRDNNGQIDDGSELFGNFTPQPQPPDGEERNGFLALAEFDKPNKGGNNDGRITTADTVFNQLRLWQDTNHNGFSEPNELHTLLSLGVARLDLDYHESRRTDDFGNQFKYRGKVRDIHGAQVGRWAWDVFFVSQP
jgi:hypothetical protein